MSMSANNAINLDVPSTNIASQKELQIQKEKQSGDENSGVAPNFKPISMVRWRGNLVSEKEAKALCHVFDNLQDHFGHQRPDPRISVTTSLAYPGQGCLWNGDLDFTYNINGEQCNLAYVSMDVCVDLTSKLVHKHGQPMLNDYANSWMYLYLPGQTIDKFKSYVKAGTGWDVSDEGFIEDPNRNLVAIEAEMHHKSGQPKPSFWVLKENKTPGDISFSRIGSIQEVRAQPHQQRIHRGVGIFSVSMEVEGTPHFKPTPGEDEAKLKFTLVSVRTWGVTECVAPIVYAPTSSK